MIDYPQEGVTWKLKTTIITIKNNTIMKTMELSPMTVAQYKGEAIVKKFMKSAKQAIASTFKFLLFISPVYPQCTQGMK